MAEVPFSFSLLRVGISGTIIGNFQIHDNNVWWQIRIFQIAELSDTFLESRVSTCILAQNG